MTLFRSVVRGICLIVILIAAVIDGQVRKLFFGLTVGPAGAVWVSAWCRRILWVMGVTYAVDGSLPEVAAPGLALVSNHLSYLDILVYSAITPCIMVSKSEVRSWPLIGWITAQAGTVYVERADLKQGRRQTHDQVNAKMSYAFRSGLPVIFYPEGTTTDGSTILPFRRGLFNSVVYGQVPVRAAALAFSLGPRNQGASVANDVCYWGDMAFLPHIVRFLGLNNIRARVAFNPQSVNGKDRFELALHTRDAVIDLYEELSGVRSIRRQVPFIANQPNGSKLTPEEQVTCARMAEASLI